jgi:PAS domain S-box-containing protein
MQFNLKLSQKGLILVAFPLLFELVFVGVLAHMLREAQNEIDREAHSRMVTQQTNEVIKHILQAAAGAGVQNMTRGGFSDQYEESISLVPNEFLQLKEVLKDDPAKVQEVEHVAQLWRKTAEVVNECKVLVERGDKFEALKNVPLLRRFYLELNRALDQIVMEEQPIQIASRQNQARIRQSVEEILLFGVALNILLAVALAVYFNRGTARRLSVLTDNTHKLAQKQPLNPGLDGADEIANLDRVFHEMASKLAASAQAERALLEKSKASEARIRAIIESMPVGLLVAKEDGAVQSANSAAASMFALTALGTPHDLKMRALFAGVITSDDNAFFQELVSKASGHIIERMARRLDGQEFPIEVTITDFKTEEQQLYLVIVIDVSERQEIARLKQEFVAMVSHELRSPLTSLRAFLSLLGEGVYGQLAEPGPRKLGLIEESVTRLINLINDLLSVEKMQTGHMQLNIEDVQAGDIVESSIESMRPLAAEHMVEIEQDVQPVSFKADKDRLVQVLVNLLSNAVKYSPSGGLVSIVVRNHSSQVEFAVTDCGKGIPASHHEAVFEKFHQVEAKDARQKGGTGLGLSISKAIVELHGGQIGLISEEGKGSSFWFRIPCDHS